MSQSNDPNSLERYTAILDQPEPEQEEIIYVSKAELKRDAQDLKQLGERIVKLSAAQRAKLPLNDAMQQALAEADRINSREAMRRHLQFIGRVLRNTDADAIKQALDVLNNSNKAGERKLQQLEQVRTELLEQGDGKVNQLVAEYPEFERQKLRQLVRKIQKQQQKQPEQTPPAYKELFQYLREIMQ